jgi:hypothetical protein
VFTNQGSGKSRSKTIDEAVSTHVDSLVDGKECAPQLLEQYPDEATVLEGLFQVSDDLYDALVPIKPRAQFVSTLKGDLKQSKATLLAEAQERRRIRMTRAINTAGMIVSVLAVTAVLTQLIGVIVMVLVYRSKRRRSAMPV